tara:strand:+ start:3792 stop:3956 length:165 start_codon:yes stop_codon:yes gene_type:complete
MKMSPARDMATAFAGMPRFFFKVREDPTLSRGINSEDRAGTYRRDVETVGTSRS